MVRTPGFHCRGPGFDQGTKILQAARRGQKKKGGGGGWGHEACLEMDGFWHIAVIAEIPTAWTVA